MHACSRRGTLSNMLLCQRTIIVSQRICQAPSEGLCAEGLGWVSVRCRSGSLPDYLTVYSFVWKHQVPFAQGDCDLAILPPLTSDVDYVDRRISMPLAL